MESKNELKEIDIKNRVCYYFDDIINGTINVKGIDCSPIKLSQSVVNKNKN